MRSSSHTAVHRSAGESRTSAPPPRPRPTRCPPSRPTFGPPEPWRGNRWQGAMIETVPDVDLIGGPEKRQIVLLAYDPAWAKGFETERRKVVGALGLLPHRVEHVGSTSVPGLAAKPIIDIQLSVSNVEDEDAYVTPSPRARSSAPSGGDGLRRGRASLDDLLARLRHRRGARRGRGGGGARGGAEAAASGRGMRRSEGVPAGSCRVAGTERSRTDFDRCTRCSSGGCEGR